MAGERGKEVTAACAPCSLQLLGLAARQGVVQKPLPNSRPEKAGVCGRENKKYWGRRWCAAQANYGSCSPESKSFVLGREQAPGPGSSQGKRPWCQVDAGRRVGRYGVEPAVRLVHRGFGAKRPFHLTQGQGASLFLN